MAKELTSQQMREIYRYWLVDLTSFEDYDLFLSYRWGLHDSDFVSALFDRLSLYSVEESKGRAIRTFLDRKRLAMGVHLQAGFLKALTRSSILIPVVSSDALNQMMKLTEREEDNLLIEWICALECVQQQPQQQSPSVHEKSRLKKLMPVFFGSRTLAPDGTGVVQDLFGERVIDRLPSIIPEASLRRAGLLLEGQGMSLSERRRKMTVREIVTELSRYLFLCVWQLSEKEKRRKPLTVSVAERVVPVLNELLLRPVASAGHPAVPALFPSPSPAALSSQPPTPPPPPVSQSLSSLSTGREQKMTLGELKELIRNDLGIASTKNVLEVLQEAAENLIEEERQQVNRITTTRERAIKIAQCLGLL